MPVDSTPPLVLEEGKRIRGVLPRGYLRSLSRLIRQCVVEQHLLQVMLRSLPVEMEWGYVSTLQNTEPASATVERARTFPSRSSI